ncbi:hypothetical protein IE53DRAFT_273455 [Violaceomyces palustris]|uniref:Uncharacterized protein n=1 Tax=Violaceomyces palustris TaxID=1673888 RepID=A0ACD0P3K3_9BASI|nr:hypothetical protein IE53DRAFT_273455 [Violaceomyces palustris]
MVLLTRFPPLAALLGTACLSHLDAVGAFQFVAEVPQSQSISIGGDYTVHLHQDKGLEVKFADHTVAASPERGAPFIRLSSSLASLTESSGNFEIVSPHLSSEGGNVVCQEQTISSFERLNLTAVRLSGGFGDHACASIRWDLDISSPAATDGLRFNVVAPNATNIHLSFHSPQSEGFLGFGESASFGNLRGLRIPIWTREGGVGRGESPVTELLNTNGTIAGTFAGGSLLTSYTAIGSFVSTKGRWGILHGSNFGIFDLASGMEGEPLVDTAEKQLQDKDDEEQRLRDRDRDNEVLTVSYEGTSLLFDLGDSSLSSPSSGDHSDRLLGKAPVTLKAITSLTKVTGRQPKLPEWTHTGAVLGIQGGQEKVEGIIREAKLYDLPVAAVWLQDWCGTRLQEGMYNISISRLWWNWEADSSLYPNWTDWVSHLETEYGVRTMSYVNTFLADVKTKSTGYKRSFYSEAKEGGRLVINSTQSEQRGEQERVGEPWRITSGPGIEAGLLDISNPTTVEWFKELVKEQLYSSARISGAMNDFGEFLSVDDGVQLSGGLVRARSFHNLYPEVWSRLMRSVVEEMSLEDRVVGFHRSASTFSARFTNLFWVGDQNVAWGPEDGLGASISSKLHMGFSGFGVSHSDVGGYTTVLAADFNVTRSLELLGRWGEVEALSSALFRTHEGNIPSVNVQAYTDEKSYRYHSFNARLFVSLADYRARLLKEYEDLGWPLVRHTAVYSDSDEDWDRIRDQSFFLGDRMFVQPVLKPRSAEDGDDDEVIVQLPRDPSGRAKSFKHIWTGNVYSAGEQVRVPAPYGRIPAFVVVVEEGIDGQNQSEGGDVFEKLWEFVEKEKDTVLEV